MVLTVSFVLSLVIGLFCHHPQCDAEHRHQVDASVEASGPHDFAVRSSRHSSGAQQASIASRTQRYDDRETPLLRGGTGRAYGVDLPDNESEIFFARGLDI